MLGAVLSLTMYIDPLLCGFTLDGRSVSYTLVCDTGRFQGSHCDHGGGGVFGRDFEDEVQLDTYSCNISCVDRDMPTSASQARLSFVVFWQYVSMYSKYMT